MTRTRFTGVMLSIVCAAVLVATSARVAAAGAQTTPQTAYVPADSLPPVESMPAGPLVIGAYAFVWVALATYVLFIARKASRAEREIADIRARLAAAPTSPLRS